MIGPKPATSRLWTAIHWAMVIGYVFFVGFKVGAAWQKAESNTPGLAFIGWALDGVQRQAPFIAGGVLALITLLAITSGIPGASRTKPQPPEGPITPSLVLQRYPVNLGTCVAALILTVWGIFTGSSLAVFGIAAAGMASVSLARRLGLEPPNDPAAPHNRGKV